MPPARWRAPNRRTTTPGRPARWNGCRPADYGARSIPQVDVARAAVEPARVGRRGRGRAALAARHRDRPARDPRHQRRVRAAAAPAGAAGRQLAAAAGRRRHRGLLPAADGEVDRCRRCSPSSASAAIAGVAVAERSSRRRSGRAVGAACRLPIGATGTGSHSWWATVVCSSSTPPSSRRWHSRICTSRCWRRVPATGRAAAGAGVRGGRWPSRLGGVGTLHRAGAAQRGRRPACRRARARPPPRG